ncbi:protein of unknown function (plasmid) [Cupriavidus taiwanensis]|nr:protein of unknown function [Cupriavidus taiwanensis]
MLDDFYQTIQRQRQYKWTVHPTVQRFLATGFSSCVRVKEFLTRLEIPCQSVNVPSDTDGRNELSRLGAR